jgi:two-component system CheB/CheR fusion protein
MQVGDNQEVGTFRQARDLAGHGSGLDRETASQLESLVAFLKQARGYDFSDYKRSSLFRRVVVRMQRLGAKGGLAEYLDVLRTDPQECSRLFGTIFINLTGFFRDPAAWDYVGRSVVPRLASGVEAGRTLRVWSAGCASGEETYSIAMLLAEALGPETLRQRVRIYATDIDDEALGQARRATYAARSAGQVPPPLLERYFERRDDRFAVRTDLRRAVIFGRHDLIRDAPIPRVDLLICRNCLMYFNAQAQERILSRFEAALEAGGVLFLGQAETLPRHSSLRPEDGDRRVFVKPLRSEGQGTPPAAGSAAPARSDFAGLLDPTPGVDLQEGRASRGRALGRDGGP